MGVDAAMVTGDNELVARNVAQQVGIKPEYPSSFSFFLFSYCFLLFSFVFFSR